MPRRIYTMKKKPAPAATKNVVRPSSLTAQQKRWTTWHLMMHPSQEKRGGKIRQKNPKSDKDTAVTSEKELTYGIERINLCDPAVNLESNSKRILAHCREGQMANKKYINNSIKRECKVLSIFKNLQNTQELKIFITNQYYWDVWRPVTEERSLRTSKFYWTEEAVQQL